uniref:SH3 domain-containing protein n=2 Tax=Photinus pyralis TaxID=7054 RepID=A0A1Y1K429_PHOPY
MKKFCNKISKQQWRVSVPNINTAIFKRSSSKEKDESGSGKIKKSASGSYDIEAAQQAFEQNRNIVKTIIAEDESSDSDSDEYQDARAMSEKLSDEMNASVYADVELPTKVDVNECSDGFDVPNISFSFFEEQNNYDYQVVNVERKQKIEPKVGSNEEDHTHISEVTIVIQESELSKNSSSPTISKSADDLGNSFIKSEYFNFELTKSLNDCSCSQRLMKSGSDPNISHSQLELEHEDDGLYKVPGAVRKIRHSHSLNDFNKIEQIDCISSAHSSIEHISCSQIIVKKSEGNEVDRGSPAMDYCRVRSKMPFKKRKVSFLRKPKATTWINLRAKFDHMVNEHAAKQRVGAFPDKDSTVIHIEEMYKSSKDKCKKILKSTGRMFKSKRDQENVDPNGEKSPKLIKASDIEYKFDEESKDDCTDSSSINTKTDKSDKSVVISAKHFFSLPMTIIDEKMQDGEFRSVKNVFRRSKFLPAESHTGFDDLRKYVKQGGDFCKELSTILQERSDAELQYAKSLSKLSGKLARACREGVGGLNDTWRSIAVELETRAEAHRVLGTALLEDATRPLKTLTENQHKIRKQAEIGVDKSTKVLSEWRAAEAKSKKHSHACARDNEKLQDALLDVRLSKTTSLIQLAHMHNQKVLSEKENAKLEGKRRKAEDAVKKADIEYYTLCVRAERARLEWESDILRGSNTFQVLEEERLNNLKSVLNSYLHHSNQLGPRLVEATERLSGPVAQADPSKDLSTFVNLRNSSQQTAEQLLPDFYCEHITLAMNRDRRKQALVKLLQLIRQDIERERKSKNGLENLSKAIKQTPNFGAEDSQQNVSEKLYHMKSMLTYLEGARYKVQNALAELDSKPKTGHPLAPHITVTRDKAGLQQSVLKVPDWLREEFVEPEKSPVSEKSIKSGHINEIDYLEPDWTDRGAADGNSNQPDSDFDEFSSQGSSATEENPVQPIAQCKALYTYTPNLPDELALHPGDVLSVYRKQEDGWWLGECKGSVGIFPATYVESLQA